MNKLKKILPSIYIALGSISLVFCFYHFNVFSSLELRLVDLRYAIRGSLINQESTDLDIVLVEDNDESFRLIPEPMPYSRGTVWSRAIRNLVDAGAKVIVIDYMFDKPDHQTQNLISYMNENQVNTINVIDGDKKLSEAISYAASNNVSVILSSKIASEPTRIPPDYILKPTTSLDYENNYGLVNITSDIDGFFRRYPIFYEVSNETGYSLGVKMALSYLTNDEHEIQFDEKNRKIAIGPLNIPTYKWGNTFVLNYFGPVSSIFSTFKTYPLSNVIDTKDYNIGEGIYDSDFGEYEYLEDSNWMDMYIDPENPLFPIFSINNPFSNKIVILGPSYEESQDLHPTPFYNFEDGKYPIPGLEIHANAAQQLLYGNYISMPFGSVDNPDRNYSMKIIILSLFIITVTLVLVSNVSAILQLLFVIIELVLWVSYSMGNFFQDIFWLFKLSLNNLLGTNYLINSPGISESILLPVLIPASAIIVPFGINLSYKLYTEGKDKKYLKNTFGTYISPDLVDQMFESKQMPELGGTPSYNTIMFSDIASFSAFSEAMTAPQLVKLLNEYLTVMTEIVINFNGTVDKYIGDAIVAFYGAPVPLEEHEIKACETALQMNEKLDILRKKWKNDDEDWPELVTNMQHRIGLNSGEIVTGNMGSELKMNYTCMGDDVNATQRLESSAKQWGIAIQVSDSIHMKSSEDFIFRKLGSIRVVGKSEPIKTYELICRNSDLSSSLKEHMEVFEKGRNYYLDQEWDKAIEYFKRSHKFEDMFKGRKTNPSLVYIDRCIEFKENPPGKNWDGVYNLTKK